MNNILFSILLVLIGLFLGFGVSFLINMLRDNLLSKKTERMLAQTKKEIDKMKQNQKELSNAEKKHQRELRALIRENNAKLNEKKRINDLQNTRKNLVYYGDTKLLSKAMNYIENNSDICVLSCFDSVEGAIENAKQSGYSRVVEITADGISEVWSKW